MSYKQLKTRKARDDHNVLERGLIVKKSAICGRLALGCYNLAMNRGPRKVPLDVACLMVGVAVFLDLLNIIAELIPVVGFVIGAIIDILILGLFYVWFHHYDVKFAAGKNAGGTLIAMVLNLFPLTDMAFPLAIRVGMLAFGERKEMPAEVAQNRAVRSSRFNL